MKNDLQDFLILCNLFLLEMDLKGTKLNYYNSIHVYIGKLYKPLEFSFHAF